MGTKQLLLPLYIVKKQSKRILGLNEKTLVILLLFVCVLSLFFIFKNLPSNVNLINDKELKNVFVPQIKVNNESNKIYHLNEKDHEKLHHKQIMPPIDNEQKEKVKNLFQTNLNRLETVKNMTLLAWNSYKKYAWGHNELKPISKVGHSPGIFGQAQLGATIIDAMDTLYLMGLMDEFNQGKEWILNNLNLNINTEMSLFEVNIRFVGGLLSVYALSKEKVFLDKAEQIATLFLPAFDSPTGLPYSLYNPQTKSKRNYAWASSCSILAEIGTLSLEFQYLSDLTGNKIFEEKIEKISQVLENTKRPEGLYFNYISPHDGNWCGSAATLGGLSDSFYEYLLKLWLYTNKKDKKLLDTYLDTLKGIENKLVGRSNKGLTFVGEYQNGLINKMGHLACFSGGLFALTSVYINELSETEKLKYKKLGEEITNTCHESYIKTATHLGPESFHFGNVEAEALSHNEKYYILRPEVVESYFYLWRITKDTKYRDWAWDMVEALEKHCKTENGYSGIQNVYDQNPRKDDVQQSFFLAETLKYLFLTFSDDNVLPLDKYVLNTEAHPFLIRN